MSRLSSAAMRTLSTVPSRRGAALMAGLAVALSACTSEGPTPPSEAEDPVVTSDDGLEGEPGTGNGWMCDYLSPAALRAVVGEEPQSPRQLVSEDDEDTWVCEVLVGGQGEQEPVVRLTIELGEEARDRARERAENADQVSEGPEHLGVSFVSPGLVTALTLCTAPGAQDRAERIPYTLVAESLGDTGEEATSALRQALTEAARRLDSSIGCSPRQAVSEDAAATTGP